MLNHRLRRWPNIKTTPGVLYWELAVCEVMEVVIVFVQKLCLMQGTLNNSSPWILKGVSATLQSGRYTLSYQK